MPAAVRITAGDMSALYMCIVSPNIQPVGQGEMVLIKHMVHQTIVGTLVTSQAKSDVMVTLGNITVGPDGVYQLLQKLLSIGDPFAVGYDGEYSLIWSVRDETIPAPASQS
jgi:hypothetical protein